MKSLLIFLALLLAGCGLGDLPLGNADLVEGPTGGDEARLMVCADFGIANCPTVYWNGPKALDCPGRDSWTYEGECVAGLQGANGILVAYPGETAIHFTAFVHEMGHWRWSDWDHRDETIWGPLPAGISVGGGYAAGSRVGDENNKLAAAGL